MNGTAAYYLNQLPPELTHGFGAIISLVILFKVFTFIISIWGYKILGALIMWLFGIPIRTDYNRRGQNNYRSRESGVLFVGARWFFRWIFSLKQNERKSEIDNDYRDAYYRQGPTLTAYPTRYSPPLVSPEPPNRPPPPLGPIIDEPEIEDAEPESPEPTIDVARVARQAEYKEFLKSEKWLALREEALNRDGRRCRCCNSVDRLEVHHRYYPKVRGTETVDALTTICHRCHSILSVAKQKNKANLADGHSSEP